MKMVSRQFMWIGFFCCQINLANAIVIPADDRTQVRTEAIRQLQTVDIAKIVPVELTVAGQSEKVNLRISHNKYICFDVLSGNKLVLNNDVNTNPNLKDPKLKDQLAANLIINQVVELNRREMSRIEGEIIIQGTPAQVVIASPWGISWNGGKVTNIPKLTLTTATIDQEKGLPIGYTVDQGLVQIQGAGLISDGNLKELKIISRTFALEGTNNSLQADVIDIILGPRSMSFSGIDQAIPTIVKPMVDGSKQYAMFVAPTNGITAGRILIASNEKGRGIYYAGQLKATNDVEINYEDFMALTPTSSLEAANLTVLSSLSKSESFENTAPLPNNNISGSKTEPQGGRHEQTSVFMNNGNISVKGDATFTMDHFQHNDKMIKAKNITLNVNMLSTKESAKIAAGSQASIYANALDLKGDVQASEYMSVYTRNIPEGQKERFKIHSTPYALKFEIGPVVRPSAH